MNRTPQN